MFKKKTVVVDLSTQDNKMYYDEKLGRYVFPGQEVEEEAPPPPPPPAMHKPEPAAPGGAPPPPAAPQQTATARAHGRAANRYAMQNF